MANDLTTTDQRQALTTSARWQEPSLSGRLAELVLGNDPLPAALPALTEDEASAARQALAVYQAAPRGSSARAVDTVMAKLIVAYPSAKLSEAEATARLDLYAEQLSDIPADVLMAGAMAATRTLRFFPSIAELRDAALSQPATPRIRRQCRLAALVAGQQRALAAPADDDAPEITAEQIRAMRPDLRAMGLKAGFIMQDEVDAALREREAA